MISDSLPSSSSHLTSLSRAYRSREWSTQSVLRKRKVTDRKRKRTRKLPEGEGPSLSGDYQCHQWFEIRPTPSKGGGIGTFSTQNIPSGHVLVNNERPIVCVPTLTNPNDATSCCQACMTPLGDLRYQLGGGVSAQDTGDLPLVGSASTSSSAALKFTEPAKDLVTCDLECGARWCSAACYEMEAGTGRIEHGLLCCGPIGGGCHDNDNHHDYDVSNNKNWKKFEPQRRFRDDVLYNPDGSQPMLLLAGKVLTTILGAIVRDLRKSANTRPASGIGSTTITEWDDETLFWWKEFAHPLWWEIGTTTMASGSANHKITTPQDEQQQQQQKQQQQLQQGRRKLCETSHALLEEALRSSISRTAKDSNWSTKKEALVVSVMERLCTVQNLGEILGMLQCNVMEVKFPSPRQQFMSHLEQVIKDKSNCNSHDNEEQTIEYKRWTEKYLLKRRAELGLTTTTSNDDAGDDDFDILEDIHSPITGSGLFPILTLANHDCDPNVSIEFLGESNRGSLVALRDISYGEEICITYIPVGDFDCGDPNGARFRNVKPTRTWLHLHQCDQQNLHSAGETGENNDDKQYLESDENCCNKEYLTQHHRGKAGPDECRHVDDLDKEEALNEDHNANIIDTKDLPEGTLWEERARSLLDYGFDCRCARCLHEQREENPPYCR